MLPTPEMILDATATYSSRRTYVLKVRSNANREMLAGRLENVVTGSTWEVASGTELLDCISEDLEASDKAAPRTSTGK